MRKFRFGITSLAGLLVVLIAGCGRETVNIPDTTRPTVTSTNPAQGATAVAAASTVTATFSESLNPATVSASTFTLRSAAGIVAGTVTYAATGSVATFTPAASLTLGTLYTATITTGVTDPSGNALAANYVWTFTTAPVPVIPPTVLAVTPLNASTNVPITQVLTATFSKAMACATLTSPATTFLLAGPGATSVAGTVSCTGSVATFTPAATLLNNTLYTATITTGAKDTSGAGLVADFTWSFTTAAAVIIPPTVVATVPLNGATGVPVNQILTATFSKAMNCATLASPSTTFTLVGPGATQVAGTVSCTGSTATFTPSSALLNSTLYTATIATGAQDTTGVALVANFVWTFTTVPALPTVLATVPLNAATGVPLNQVLTAIFTKPMNCATLTSPATTFLLTGPNTTAVTGTVSCTGNTATFTPAAALATNTLYTATITTGATDLTGNGLAASYVWTFRTVPATTPPTVISTTPANNATAVALNQSVSATFSVAMNPTTISGTTFTLTAAGGVAVAGAVSYAVAGSVATFTPTASLLPSTVYTATVTTGAADLTGTPLAANYVWTFTTGVSPDTTKPTVVSTIPLNGAVAVPFNQSVSAIFSKPLNAASVSGTTFTLTAPGGISVVGLVSYAGIANTATFTPTANLAPSTLYTATLTTGIQDLAGNTLAADYVWTFTTGALPDTTPPQLTSTIPSNEATAVPINQTISATFSEAMDPLTITTTTFQVSLEGTPVTGTVVYDPINFIATFVPTVQFVAGTTYAATVTTGATDLAGNALGTGGAPNPWTFTTGATVVQPPVALGTAITYGGFGGSAGITNQGINTVINGDIGTTGVSTLVTGFHDDGPGCVYTETLLNKGAVNGAINTSPPPPTVGCPTEGTAITQALAAQAAADALTAYNALVAFPNGLDVSVCPGCGGGSAGELGNRVLPPGIYKSAPGSFDITQGNLTLDAKGDPNAFWVFQMATTLTVGTPASNRSVLLVNGAQAKNVFWQVGSAATINGILGGGTMMGTIISQLGISISTPGVNAVTNLNGRALVLTGPLTIVNTVINVPAP